MSTPRPWEGGDERDRWNGYLDFSRIDGEIGYPVLRNKVDASTYADLRVREDRYAMVRGLTLGEHGIPSSYDLDGLRDVHRHLFQDVYEWAGQVRTVNIVKGEAFAPPETIEPLMAGVAEAMRETDLLRAIPEHNYAEALATVYNTINTAHPFREGNGRTQRLFVDALAAESGHRLDWTKVHGRENDDASERARAGDLTRLTAMFNAITSKATSSSSSRTVERGVSVGTRPQSVRSALPGERSYGQRSRGRPGPSHGYGR